MAIELFRRVSSLTTLRGRVAIYNARKNRLAKHVVIKKLIPIWKINVEVQDTLDIRWDIA